MFTATVPVDGGALPDTRSGGELAHLLDSAAPERDAVPCRQHDPDLWFAEAPADLERAKELCRGCPVRASCLASALSRQEPWGVWGGEIFERGAVIARKRPRGRPSKAALERERIEREQAERVGAERDQATLTGTAHTAGDRAGRPADLPGLDQAGGHPSTRRGGAGAGAAA